ncbi:MAG: hypothetical protein AB8B51_05710 [Sedimentitalea sp.]
MGPSSILSSFRCPRCDAFQHAGKLWRTNPHRASIFGALASTPCVGCGIALRLSDARKWRMAALCLFVFFAAAILGFALVTQFEMLLFTSPLGQEKSNFAAFVIVMGVFVYPSVTLCTRLRQVEVAP